MLLYHELNVYICMYCRYRIYGDGKKTGRTSARDHVEPPEGNGSGSGSVPKCESLKTSPLVTGEKTPAPIEAVLFDVNPSLYGQKA